MIVTVDNMTPDAGTVWVASGITKCRPGSLVRVDFGVDHRVAQNLYEAVAYEGEIDCEVEGWQVLSTRSLTCPDCSGSGTVPAGGWEAEEHVSNGQVPCNTCTSHCALCEAGEGSLHTYEPASDL